MDKLECTLPSSIQSLDIRVDLIIPNESNVNEMNEDTFNRLVDEISEVGFINPIQVIPLEDGRYKLIGGEHRWKAAKFIGMTHVPSVILTDERWADEDFSDLVMFKLNMLKGNINNDKFVTYYERMVKKFGESNLQYVLAITSDQEWKKMKKGVISQLKNSGLPDAVIKDAEEAEKGSKSPEDFGKKLGKIFDKYAKTSNSNYVIFQQGDKEHMMIHASVENFSAIKKIAEICGETGCDVNDLLQPVLAQVIIGLNTHKKT